MKKEKFMFRVLIDHLGAAPSVIAKALIARGTTTAAQRTIEKSIINGLNLSTRQRPTKVVMDFLDEAHERQLQEIDAIVIQAIESRDKNGTAKVELPYYTSQADYDALHDDGYDWHMTNATLRLAAERLKGLGFDVEFVFANEVFIKEQ